MNPQQMMEENDRLARLCEAQDTENKRLEHLVAHHDIALGVASNQLSEAQATIAMQAEALKVAEHFIDRHSESWYTSGQRDLAQIRETISATSETVAAWRAKETEPLRREVAMYKSELNKLSIVVGEYLLFTAKSTDLNGAYLAARSLLTGKPCTDERMCSGCFAGTGCTNNPQAAALAYEREVKAKALEEFGEKYRCVYLIHRGAEIYVGPELKELADKEAAEIRASKGE